MQNKQKSCLAAKAQDACFYCPQVEAVAYRSNNKFPFFKKKNIYIFIYFKSVSFGLLLFFFMANSSKSNLGSHNVLFTPVCDCLKDCRDFVDTFHGLFFF